MADLSAYASFAVELDRSGNTPVIKVTDTSDYPVGVGTGITASVVIVQPDGMEVTGGVDENIELRLASNDDFQKGKYTILFKAVHTSYDDTELEKSFYLFYTPPNVTIEQNFNVFTPSLKAKDDTVYSIAGFTLDQVTRSWQAIITNVGNVTGGNSAEFDIKYSGSYYDSAYLIKLASYPVYHLTNDVSITVKDKIEVSALYRTKVPKSLNDIFAQIIVFKKGINKKKCKHGGLASNADFAYIMSLFEFYKARGLCGTSLEKLIDIHDELVELLADCFEGQKNTYLPIAAYSFNDFCGCCSGETETPVTPPTVNAGNNSTITLPTSSMTLNGTATGTGLTYLWTKDSGQGGSSFGTPNALSTTVTGLTEGVHVFRLTVTDTKGQTAYDTVTVTVAAADALNVNAGSNQTITLPTSQVTLTATSNKTGGSYEWSQITGPNTATIQTANQASTVVSGLVQGTYEFEVGLTNGQETASDLILVTVNPAAQPTTHPVNYGWTNTAVNSENVDDITLNQSITVNNGAASFGFTAALEYVYLVISEPASEPVKVRYSNVLNNEPIPDFTWAAPVVIGSTRYYFTKGPMGFDGTGPTNFYTT